MFGITKIAQHILNLKAT